MVSHPTLRELRKNVISAGLVIAAVTLSTLVVHFATGWC